jgi:hypothetical protein
MKEIEGYRQAQLRANREHPPPLTIKASAELLVVD